MNAPAQTAADDLSVIEPDPKPTPFAGRLAQIRPLRVGQLPAFARALRPMLDPVLEAVLSDRVDVHLVVGLIADHGEGFVQLMSIGSGIPVDELNDADPADLIAIASAVLSVNRDFFSGRMMTAIRPVLARKAAAG